jgi:hypothetical protein
MEISFKPIFIKKVYASDIKKNVISFYLSLDHDQSWS